MKSFFIVLTFTQCLHLHENSLIIKFPRIGNEYGNKVEKFSKHQEVNLLHKLTRKSRFAKKIICKMVMESKQFIYAHEFENTLISRLQNDGLIFTSYDSANIVPKFVTQHVRVRSTQIKLEMLQCTSGLPVIWSLIYGMVDKFMYLVEPVYVRGIPTFNNVIAAIIEPEALLKSSDTRYITWYFWSQLGIGDNFTQYVPILNFPLFDLYTCRHVHQFAASAVHKYQNYDSVLERMKLVCRLNLSDHVRVCSSAFEVLSKEGYFQDDVKYINYIVRGSRSPRCKSEIAIDLHPYSEDTLITEALPCVVNTVISIPLFYVLADTLEKGSIFILFYEPLSELLKIEALLGKIGALMNPALSYQRPNKRAKLINTSEIN